MPFGQKLFLFLLVWGVFSLVFFLGAPPSTSEVAEQWCASHSMVYLGCSDNTLCVCKNQANQTWLLHFQDKTVRFLEPRTLIPASEFQGR